MAPGRIVYDLLHLAQQGLAIAGKLLLQSAVLAGYPEVQNLGTRVTFTITWWMIPTFLTVISVIWAIWASFTARHVFDSIGIIIFGCGVSMVNCLAWMSAALVK